MSESLDGGASWSTNRQVTTGGGQCHGHAVRLAAGGDGGDGGDGGEFGGGGAVVLVTDHRYPRPTSSARAFVSDDGGRHWRDENYYLNNGAIAGFARTISLDGGDAGCGPSRWTAVTPGAAAF
eukprot:SAG22_NODE_2922_length_2101_cov_1.501499_2_plen_123_part_00